MLAVIHTPSISPEKDRLPPEEEACLSSLDFDYVNRLKTLWALFSIKADTVTFGKAPEAAALDGRMMDKNIVVVFTGDEAKTFIVIEPLNCSLFHSVSLLIRRLES
jgi:hypothetical protein